LPNNDEVGHYPGVFAYKFQIFPGSTRIRPGVSAYNRKTSDKISSAKPARRLPDTIADYLLATVRELLV
jgi:hypothetical protein